MMTPFTMQRSFALLVCSMVSLWVPGSTQNLATPVEKVTQMLQDMKDKSETLKTSADATYAKVKTSCETTIQTKKDEIVAVDLELERLGAEIMQITTDTATLVTQINDDNSGHEMDSKVLADLRKTRASEQAIYKRDLAEYDTALSAVDRAIVIMKKQGSFMQVSRLRKSSREAQNAIKEIAHSIRQLSVYTPEGGMLAKDEKIFDEFNTLTTNSGAYKAGAGPGKGVAGVLEGLKSTFGKARDEIMKTETTDKETSATKEANLIQQLESARDSLTANKENKALGEEMKMKLKGELSQAKLNKDSTAKFLAKTEQVCAEKKVSYEEMTKLRANEITALTKAVEIIKGTVTTNSESLNAKAGRVFAQIQSRGQPNDAARYLVKSLNVFLNQQAGELNSHSLVLLGKQVKVLVAQSPNDAIAKVKKMIEDLILKMQKASAQEATQKAWCDDELTKNDKEQQTAQAQIETNTASVKKLGSDIKMLKQEVILLNQKVTKNKKEETDLEASRATEKADNEKTIKEANESTTAVQAAITVLTEYYKEAAKATALVQATKQTPTPNETPKDITADDVEGPLASEGGNVIAMLEVVRDNYKTLIAKTEETENQAQASYTVQIIDTKVMITTGESEVANKEGLIADNEKTLPQKQADLTASKTSLSDAESSYENLKAPCLNGNAAEDRKQQVEAEIAALKEALTMLEAYEGTFLLQESRQEAVSEQAASQVPATTDQIKKVAKLLDSIKTDVEKDLADDTAAHAEMTKWCTATISETKAALVTQRDRDGELVTAIEVSTQQKTILATQLTNLKSEVAKNTESLNQMGQLRNNDLKGFQTSEKETMVAISALRSAISVLRTKYAAFDKADKRDFAKEQEAIKPTASLSNIASNVAKALKLLPTAEFNLAVTGQTGAILQGFLSRPDDFVQPVSKHAGLTQTGSEVVSGGDGKAILGILETLMETFTADLKAMQDRESQGIETYGSTKEAKEAQISAMDASISTKESQLAHYTTMNAQAKEDLAYLRETNTQDLLYLKQVTDQCSTSENEFKVRKQTRDNEIAALAEGISILTAGSGVSSPSPPPTPATKVLIHTDRRVTRKVFVHPHDSSKKRTVVKLAAAKVQKLAAPKQPPTKPKVAVVTPKVSPSLLESVVGGSPLHRSLAVLSAQVRLAHRQLSMGPLTLGAIKSVVTQIDVVVVQLQTAKKMEIKKQETCVSENNAATEQRQRRKTDKSKIDNTIATLTADIKQATEDMAALATQIEDLTQTIVDAKAARTGAHDEYKKSVQEQLNQQKLLHNAIAALRKFYAAKKGTTLLQVLPAQAKHQTLQPFIDALEQQLRNAGQEITERHIEATGEQTEQYDAWAHNANIKTICETGFNAGHSALRFLAQSNATLYEFDLGVHSYGKIAAAYLMDKFPSRLHTLWGDSSVLLPLFQHQRPDVHCDLMIVDGGRSYEAAAADLTNFANMASPNHVLVMNDAACTAGLCAGPSRAWQELIQKGCVVQTQAVAMGPERGFSVGRFAPCSATAAQNNQPSAQVVPAEMLKAAAGVKLVAAANHSIAPVPQSGLPSSVTKTTSKEELPMQVPTVKLVAQAAAQAPQTKEQQALDDGVKSNMETKWGNVKDSKAKRVEKPKGFAKPLKAHTGTTGIIGILQIILQDSESLIEQDVKDEQSEVDLHLANVQQTKEVIAGKERESTMLDQGKNDNELKKTQNEQQLAAVTKEIKEIEDFLAIVDTQCKTFLVNFESNQEARAAEISDTTQAKEVLLGMNGASAAVLTQLAQTVQHAAQSEH